MNCEHWLVDHPRGWNAGLTCPPGPCGGGEGEVQVMNSRWVVNSAQQINARPLQNPYFRIRTDSYFMFSPFDVQFHEVQSDSDDNE